MNFTDSSLATSISDLFLKAIVLNERKQQRDEKLILARIKEQPKAMQVARGRASGLLSTYHTTARHHASELLHALFSTPRGARTKLPADKQDAVHAMLDLRPNEALLDPAHPVCKEYPAAAGAPSFEYFLLQEQKECKFSAGTPTKIRRQPSSIKLSVSFAFISAAIVASANLFYVAGRPLRELEVGRRQG